MAIVDENERCNNAAVSQCGAVLHPVDVLVALFLCLSTFSHILYARSHYVANSYQIWPITGAEGNYLGSMGQPQGLGCRRVTSSCYRVRAHCCRYDSYDQQKCSNHVWNTITMCQIYYTCLLRHRGSKYHIHIKIHKNTRCTYRTINHSYCIRFCSILLLIHFSHSPSGWVVPEMSSTGKTF